MGMELDLASKKIDKFRKDQPSGKSASASAFAEAYLTCVCVGTRAMF